MKTKSITLFDFASRNNFQPMVMLRLDLGELKGKESREVADFNVRLLELLPGLRKHFCTLGCKGGFVRRLHQGTHFNHVVEHIALELMALAGFDYRNKKACNGDERDDSKVVLETTSVETTRYLLPVAADLAESLIVEESFFLEEKIAEAKRIGSASKPRTTAQRIVEIGGRQASL